ncbi:MAG: hypothetical protein J6Y00_03145 [Paludibacteraceae bacterium]|nr:hypothetical protein [Paludibacteraceae bacterium]
MKTYNAPATAVYTMCMVTTLCASDPTSTIPVDIEYSATAPDLNLFGD